MVYRPIFLIMLVAVACGGESMTATPDAAPDAGAQIFSGPTSPDIGEVTTAWMTTPAPPQLTGISAAPPMPGPCPDGWMTVPLADGHTCEPPSARTDCAEGEVSDIDGTCRLFGATCPADGWPSNLPTEQTIVYVDAAATPPGDGTLAAPYVSVVDAVAAAPSGAVLALRSGDHQGPLLIDKPLTLLGACASGTRLVSTVANEALPIVIIESAMTLREVTLSGERPGLALGAPTSSPVELDTVAIRDVISYGVLAFPDTRLEARNLWVSGVQAQPSSGQFGTFIVGEDATVVLQHAVLEDGAFAGINTIGGAITVVDSVIRRVELSNGDFGQGIYGFESRISLERVVIEDVRDSALRAFGAEVDATHLALRDVRPGPRQPLQAYGLFAEQGSRVRVTGGLIQRLGIRAVVAVDPGTTVDLADVRIAQMLYEESAGRILATQGGQVRLDRVWIDAEGGVRVLSPGSSANIRNLTYRPPPNPPLVRQPAIYAGEGARTVTATAVDVVAGPAAAVLDSGSRVQIRGLRVRHDNDTAENAVIRRGTLELREAEIENSASIGILVQENGTLIAEDVSVDGGAASAILSVDSQVNVARLRVDGAADRVLSINGGRANVRDVVIDRPLGQPDMGPTIWVTTGATVSFSRLRLTQNHRQCDEYRRCFASDPRRLGVRRHQ